eukprot:m.237717 g.237717  ORF g.237717 m.237717 type:complete len:186 (-) comp18958_c1_seq11:49-606(-)
MTWTWGQTLLAHAVVACCVPAAGKPTQTLRDTQALPPNFLIGAMKSGTSFLHARLLEHSHCVKATRLPGEPSYAYKELHFFNTKRYHTGIKQFWRHWPEQVCAKCQIVDGTPNYLPTPEVPARIAETFPEWRHKLRYTTRLCYVLLVSLTGKHRGTERHTQIAPHTSARITFAHERTNARKHGCK